jgi:copper(I)-binding protein
MNKALFALLLLAISQAAQAGVTVANAWARATVPGQDVGAAYMTLTSDKAAKLVGIKTPAADSVEIHEMSMKNGVMKMRMKDVLDLPAGTAVKLEPSGFHFMLFDLKKPLKAGENIELTLSLKDSQGKLSTQNVRVPVKAE